MTTSKPSKRRRAPSPLSLRLTPEERARLSAEAGKQTLSAHIRTRLFSDSASGNTGARSDAHPTTGRLSHQTQQRLLAQILGLLGQSSAFRSLNDLAEAARIGVLPLTPDVQTEIRAACAAIQDIRQTLLIALGLKPEKDDRRDSER